MYRKADNEDMEYFLYPTVDPEDGGFAVCPDLSDTCLVINDLEKDNKLTQYNQGVWDTLNEIMATPLAQLQEKLLAIMEKITDDEMINGSFVKDDEDDEVNEMIACKVEDTKSYTNNKPSNIPELDDDISDEELEAEFKNREQNKTYANGRSAYGYDDGWYS